MAFKCSSPYLPVKQIYSLIVFVLVLVLTSLPLVLQWLGQNSVETEGNTDNFGGDVADGKVRSWSPKQHIFISSAFDIGGVESANKTYNIRLIVLTHNRDGPYLRKAPPVLCKSDADEIVAAEWSPLGAPMPCKWKDYFMDCNFSQPVKNLMILGGNRQIEIPITPVVTQKIPLVVCYGRAFFFEQWQIALASIETYLFYGADLMVIPIVSVIKDLHTILEFYERQGKVKLKNGVIMPVIPELAPYQDPNAHTDSLNIMTSNTECLYEYRQAAEFMLFADFDDIFIPRKFNTIYEEVLALSNRFPTAPSFRFPWAKAKFVMEETPFKFNITEMFSIFHIDSTSDKGKSIFRPLKIRRGLVHGPHFEGDYLSNVTEVRLGYGEMFNIHLRDATKERDWFKFKGNNLYKGPSDFRKIQKVFRERIQSDETAEKAFNSLPLGKPFFEAAVKCAEDTYRQKRTKDMCMSPLDCKYNIENPIPCMVMKPKFRRFDNGKGIILHSAVSKELVEKEDCSLIY
ncbi:unnamed protein product [Bursaphelenchus xylophilus]|uniref:Glycosyltransferase family 92 protein n=1 Tax=Bursaphelenchus xylophilus TaxID=6326 RepID=A0A1I7SAK4_BURXY|nr:unnamed protein product [Bursaphelenchus xylophilus]CAG9079276.1 unnamed protein product [Bursaphelenchus xylophilus]